MDESELKVVFVVENAKNSQAKKLYFYMNHYGPGTDFPENLSTDRYIQSVIVLDTPKGERHFLELVMGYKSAISVLST